MAMFLMWLSGLLVGIGITIIYYRRKKEAPLGTLRIDRSDPDGPYIFIELYEDIPVLAKREEGRVLVEFKDYVSHK